MRRKLIIIATTLVALGAAGAAAAGALYYTYPVQVSIFGGLTRNYFLSWFAPPGATTTELNADFKDAGTVGRGKWVVLIAGSAGSALRAVGPPNLHITSDVRRVPLVPLEIGPVSARKAGSSSAETRFELRATAQEARDHGTTPCATRPAAARPLSVIDEVRM